MLSPSSCPHCAAEFQPKVARQRFCSTICQKQNPNKPWLVERSCEVCQATFRIARSAVAKGGGRFCSRTCMGKGNIGEGSPKWKGGAPASQARWRAANPEYRQNYAKEYRAANPERMREYNRRAREKNRDTYIARQRERYHRVRRDPEVRKQIKLERAREKRLQRYGLTSELYAQLLADQAGGCAICTTPLATRVTNGLHVDHDHATGAVRGLLCGKCNTGLGMYRDSIELMQRAIEYLRHHAAKAIAA
jgi:Recombination endonuclease VII